MGTGITLFESLCHLVYSTHADLIQNMKPELQGSHIKTVLMNLTEVWNDPTSTTTMQAMAGKFIYSLVELVGSHRFETHEAYVFIDAVIRCFGICEHRREVREMNEVVDFFFSMNYEIKFRFASLPSKYFLASPVLCKVTIGITLQHIMKLLPEFGQDKQSAVIVNNTTASSELSYYGFSYYKRCFGLLVVAVLKFCTKKSYHLSRSYWKS
ncbi:hypothetical protein VP01_1625g7 [Puccinia sorghi]|uniref:Uncharacterized protein n=1 Tax=Puccinia sorghi TaxID=27349 RepID=A0A0L6VGY2_9BASI|nr:hypothetical protein VP01_1625g7 [Puccinia sorghi]